MDVFNHDLEAIEAAGFRCCYLCGKIVTQVLVDDAIRGGEECKNMGEKVALVFRQLGPVHDVCGEVDLLNCPEGGFVFLYMCQMSGCWMGNSTKRWGFSCSSGSGARGELSFMATTFVGERFLGERLCCNVVFAQNSSHSKPLLWMKVVMSWKAWNVMGCAMVEYGGLAWKRSQSLPLSRTKLVIAQKTWYGTMGNMVLCVGGEETNSFFMGGRECEDGEGARGGSVKLVLEMVTVFLTGKSGCLFLYNLWSFFSSCLTFSYI